MKRTTLQSKMAKLGIDRAEGKPFGRAEGKGQRVEGRGEGGR
jgi:hypothetical protein